MPLAGPVHLLALNSEVNMSRGSAQWNFAVADLAAVDRTKTPFVVMQWHRLMYSPASPGSSDYSWGDQVGSRMAHRVARSSRAGWRQLDWAGRDEGRSAAGPVLPAFVHAAAQCSITPPACINPLPLATPLHRRPAVHVPKRLG